MTVQEAAVPAGSSEGIYAWWVRHLFQVWPSSQQCCAHTLQHSCDLVSQHSHGCTSQPSSACTSLHSCARTSLHSCARILLHSSACTSLHSSSSTVMRPGACAKCGGLWSGSCFLGGHKVPVSVPWCTQTSGPLCPFEPAYGATRQSALHLLFCLSLSLQSPGQRRIRTMLARWWHLIWGLFLALRRRAVEEGVL